MTTDSCNVSNYYEVLQCDKTATNEELKKSYQNLIRHHHPDKLSDESNSEQTFHLIQKAWTILKDPLTRKQYDAELSCSEFSDHLVYETLNLSDLNHNSSDQMYSYPCRCGGTYLVNYNDLKPPNVIVACDECSFSIHINLSGNK